MASGLSLNSTIDELTINTLFMCGGGTKNPVFLREHADITGCVIHLPRQPEAVLTGAAILAAVASNAYPDCRSAMSVMSASGRRITPTFPGGNGGGGAGVGGGDLREYHDRKHRVYLRMYDDQRAYDSIMG
jgi:ribulose kinase